MRRWVLCVSAAFSAVSVLAPGPIRAAGGDEEQRLIEALGGGASAAEKDQACQRLKQIGTARCVPALAAVLTDKELSHSARYALESMVCPEAGNAMREALGKTSGGLRVGIIASLGERRDAKSAATMAGLLGDADATTAAAAAAALGRIGGPDALAALQAALPKASGAVRAAAVDSLLQCADALLAAGDAKAASAVYKALSVAKEQPHVRVAAFRGLALAAGDRAAEAAAAGLTTEDVAARVAALQLARQLPGRAATATFAAVLPKAPPAVQVSLLAVLAQRSDEAAAPAAMAALTSPAPDVRAAAMKALAELGDASCVGALAEAAAKAPPEEQKAAREALMRLRRGPVREAILAALAKANPAVQAELVRALAGRRDSAAAPQLLEMARTGQGPVQAAALRALVVLGDDGACTPLVAVLAAGDEPIREAAEAAIAAISARSPRRQALAGPLLAALKTAPAAARPALLRLAARIGGAEAMAALRTASGEQDAELRDAAIRALADLAGVEAAQDLLGLARQAPDPTGRILAMRGYWRVVGLAESRSAQERWKLFEAGLAIPQRPEEKKLALAELARLAHISALRQAESLCSEEAVRAEAETAAVRIAAALAGSQGPEARAALRRLAETATHAPAREEARKALEAMDQYVGYVAGWMAAGPYRIAGKECQALFDIPLGPELAGQKVDWKPCPSPADPPLPWQADLSGIVGGDHCVAYLRARAYVPQAQRVRLEIGTDDGVKLWINGKLAWGNNAIRGLTPGQDKAQADLKEGWNDLLLKITQHTLGCGACVRIRAADGAAVEGLRFDGGQGEGSRN